MWSASWASGIGPAPPHAPPARPALARAPLAEAAGPGGAGGPPRAPGGGRWPRKRGRMPVSFTSPYLPTSVCTLNKLIFIPLSHLPTRADLNTPLIDGDLFHSPLSLWPACNDSTTTANLTRVSPRLFSILRSASSRAPSFRAIHGLILPVLLVPPLRRLLVLLCLLGCPVKLGSCLSG